MKIYKDIKSYIVAYRKAKYGTILTDKETPFILIDNPKGCWCADPFIFEHNNQTYIFAEIFTKNTELGRLGYCKITDSGVTPWKIVIREKYHLSYPNIFRINDDIYIIPESNKINELYCYKAIDFPNKWKKYKIINENINANDTTLYLKNNNFICFSFNYLNKKEFAFKMDKDFNFINFIDVKGSYEKEIIRPGGNFFKYNDKTIAVCQDCRNFYGESLFFYNVEINEDEINIKDIIMNLKHCDIKTNNKINSFAIHTYNGNNNYEVVDLNFNEKITYLKYNFYKTIKFLINCFVR